MRSCLELPEPSVNVSAARALYRRPEILFLDEATEAVIAGALRDLAMTRVIITHRPATIAHAQEVLELG